MLKVILIKLKSNRFFLGFFIFVISCKHNNTSKIKNFTNYDNLIQIKTYNLYLNQQLHSKQKYLAACKIVRHQMRWLIAGEGFQDKDYISSLLSDVSPSCNKDFRKIECSEKFYNYLNYVNSLCKQKHQHIAKENMIFLEWMSILRGKWNAEFFNITKKLLKTSWKSETEIVLLGTLRNFLKIKINSNPILNITLFLRIWGISCPELTSDFSDKGAILKSDKYLPAGRCLPTCEQAKILEPLSDFQRRRAKILKYCIPKDVNLINKQDMKYISLDNYLVFKTSKFLNSLFSDIFKSKSAFIQSNLKWINPIRQQYIQYKIYLSFSELSSTEEGYIDIPFSFASYLLPKSTHYVTVDSFSNIRFGERPLFQPSEMKVIKGTPYPGLKINGLWEQSLDLWLKKIKNNPSILLDSKASISLFLRIAKTLKNNGYDRIELILKNQYNLLRSFNLKIWESLPEKYILVHVGPGLMTVSSSFKVFKKDKYDSNSPYDFSGLRQRLERIKWRHSHKVYVIIKVEDGISWSSFAKLIGYLTQNTSGRKLFEKIGILISNQQSDQQIPIK